jgi:RNA polymerase sigma-70 factor (ECF subfamily)
VPRSEARQDAGELYRRHAPFVARFLVRLGVARADLDDVLQEVFLTAHRLGGYRPGPARPTTWLAAIGVRVASTHRRGVSRRREDVTELAALRAPATTVDPAQAAEHGEALARVQAALEALDAEHRAVFVLYEIEGASGDEIAAALAVPVGTVYSRLHHARRRFAEAHAGLIGAPRAASGGRR